MAKAKLAAPKVAKPKSSAGQIFVGVLFGSAAIALPFLQANTAVDWAMVQLLGFGQPYRTTVMPKPALTGFSAKNVEIETNGAPIRIGEVTFEAPTPWVLAATYTRSMFTPGLNRVKISYNNIDNPDGYSLASQELPIGPRSGAFAELEGCGNIARINDSQLKDLGLTPGETSMTYEIDIAGSTVTTTETQSTPGLGTTTFTRVGDGTRPGKRLFERYGLPGDIIWKKHSWQFKDEGFIKARNEFCARESGVTIATFLANHIASIERNMAAIGVTVGPEVRAMYIDYAANGGKLVVTGEFSKDLVEADYDDIPWGEQLLAMQSEMQRDKQRLSFSFQAQRERPFSEDEDLLTTFEVLKREGLVVDPLTLPEPGAYAQAAANADATAALPDDNSASETMVVQVKVDPLLSSKVVAVPDEDPIFITNFDQVANLVGRKIRIERRARPVMVATVVGRGETGLRLRVSIASGFAEIEVARGEFVRAQVYPLR
jgi:hypothetical protein